MKEQKEQITQKKKKRMQNMDTLHRFFVVVITYQICKKRDRPKTSVTKYKRKIVALWK